MNHDKSERLAGTSVFECQMRYDTIAMGNLKQTNMLN